MSIQYNIQLDKLTAVDQFGVVLAIHDPQTHGDEAAFRKYATSLIEGGE